MKVCIIQQCDFKYIFWGAKPACVVVVHSCKLQGHIKHEWEGHLGDVGQIPPFVTKPCGLGSPKRTNPLGVGLGGIPNLPWTPSPHRKYAVFFFFGKLQIILLKFESVWILLPKI